MNVKLVSFCQPVNQLNLGSRTGACDVIRELDYSDELDLALFFK